MLPGAQSLRESQIAKQDPRCQPGAYVTDSVHLGEVIEQKAGEAVVECCGSGVRWQIPYVQLVVKWELVRAAPVAPDCLEAA